MLLQMLFVEGNHFCPSCEKSGNCQLQALGYALGVMTPHFDHFFPTGRSTPRIPEMLLDFNRCILCELCVRASGEVDGKNVFALSGRGIDEASDRQCRIGPARRHELSRRPTRRPRSARSA